MNRTQKGILPHQITHLPFIWSKLHNLISFHISFPILRSSWQYLRRFCPHHPSSFLDPLYWVLNYVTPSPYPVYLPTYFLFMLVNQPYTATLCKYLPSNSKFEIAPPLTDLKPIPPPEEPYLRTSKYWCAGPPPNAGKIDSARNHTLLYAPVESLIGNDQPPPTGYQSHMPSLLQP